MFEYPAIGARAQPHYCLFVFAVTPVTCGRAKTVGRYSSENSGSCQGSGRLGLSMRAMGRALCEFLSAYSFWCLRPACQSGVKRSTIRGAVRPLATWRRGCMPVPQPSNQVNFRTPISPRRSTAEATPISRAALRRCDCGLRSSRPSRPCLFPWVLCSGRR